MNTALFNNLIGENVVVYDALKNNGKLVRIESSGRYPFIISFDDDSTFGVSKISSYEYTMLVNDNSTPTIGSIVRLKYDGDYFGIVTSMDDNRLFINNLPFGLPITSFESCHLHIVSQQMIENNDYFLYFDFDFGYKIGQCSKLTHTSIITTDNTSIKFDCLIRKLIFTTDPKLPLRKIDKSFVEFFSNQIYQKMRVDTIVPEIVESCESYNLNHIYLNDVKVYDYDYETENDDKIVKMYKETVFVNKH